MAQFWPSQKTKSVCTRKQLSGIWRYVEEICIGGFSLISSSFLSFVYTFLTSFTDISFHSRASIEKQFYPKASLIINQNIANLILSKILSEKSSPSATLLPVICLSPAKLMLILAPKQTTLFCRCLQCLQDVQNQYKPRFEMKTWELLKGSKWKLTYLPIFASSFHAESVMC